MKVLASILVASLVALTLIGAAVAQRGTGDTVAFLDAALRGAFQAEEATGPADFGMPVPTPEPSLPEGADPFNPPLLRISKSPPAVAEFSRTADRDEIVSMTGIKLDHSAEFEIFSQAPSAAKGNVTAVNSLRADKTAATVLLPAALPEWSMYLMWPNRNGYRGQPIAINRTEAWWLGPNKGTAGTVISVYGRNLTRSDGTSLSYLYIKPPGASGSYVKPSAVNPFKVDFAIPDMPAGNYEVWVHNTHGGRFGWSGPLRLDVLARSPWADQKNNLLDVKRFGAVGDGTTDDTAALQRALEAAKNAAPATIHFPAGTYRITSFLTAPANVGWVGDGMNTTEIRLDRSIDHSMIEIAGENVQFEGLALNANRNTGKQVLMQVSSAENLRIASAKLNAWGVAALQANGASGLSISDSDLVENGSFYGSSRQVFLSGNKFRMTGYGESVAALWGGRDFSMVGNELSNADESRDDGHGIGRFFVGQAQFGSISNLYWGNNTSLNAAPHDCDKVDCNKGEQICFEMVGSKIKSDFVKATADTVSFKTLSDLGEPTPGGQDLVIVGGRGAGQHRHIVSSADSTVMLDAPWNVIPDRTSRFALAATASKVAIYNNKFDGRSSYSQHDSDSTSVLLYGNVYDAVVDSNRISRMRHGMMTIALDSTRGLAPYFLQYSNNTVSDSNSGLYVGTTFAESGKPGIWGGLGNIYRNNRFENLAHIGVEYETWAHDGSDYNGTVFERNSFKNVPYGFVEAYQLMWTYDGRFKAAPGSHSMKVNTILHRNDFDRGSAVDDGSVGFVTLHPSNSWLNIGSTWTDFASGNDGPVAPKALPN
ncbi:glycosyl hydrolase family 28-related protein [Neorhizobium sp. P12A]|uniref:glycosyl hydrolase family 28-related protein n=1 Tax=Neorhizobium sp. P12A TaxID=2268027 RepID=UPI001FEF4EA1|nr:glycosyl hydrolase family 28-related protein [Neorhizobium sp. P12A]